MGYLHIQNLYKCQDILLFNECFALEKIHGTSSHISWDGSTIKLFSGGASLNSFTKLFDIPKLTQLFAEHLGNVKAIIYGEAYGGKMQGMSATYGKDLKFIVFDIRINDNWLDVPNAESIAQKLGLEFVHYVKIRATIEEIDRQRDSCSIQAIRNGMGEGKLREGIVLRPLIELTKNNDSRIICKHKRKEFSERQNTPKVLDPAKLAILTEASQIAEEWVTDMRLIHVLDKLPNITDLSSTPIVIRAMVEDVYREAEGEISQNKEVAIAIGRKTAQLFKKYINENNILD